MARLQRLGFLDYSFVETVEAMHPFYVIRAIGGLLFLVGALIMAFNIWRTIRADATADRAEPPRIAAPAEYERSLDVNALPALWRKHGSSRRNSILLLLGILIVVADRRPGRDRAAVLSEEHDRDGRRACGPTRRSSSPGRDIYVREGCYICHSR